jgi:autotransporter-associated beta strand protein
MIARFAFRHPVHRFASLTMNAAFAAVAACGGLWATPAAAQFTWATDDGGNYGGGWNNGTDGGTGFGAWGLAPTASAGNFIGNPSNNGMGTTGIGTTTFGLYSSGGDYFNGGRAFDSAMQIGDSFSFWWAMNFDAGGGNKGIDFKANNSTVFNLNNGNSAAITTSNGTADPNYGTTPMLVTTTRTSGSTYGFSMTSRSGGATYFTTISSTAALDSFNLYIGNQNNGAGEKNIYFNSFAITSGTYNFGGVITESRALTGGGALTVSGSTTLALTSAGNTFSGGSTVAAGSTLQIGNGGANGSLSGGVANSGNVAFNSTSALGYAGSLTGSGTVSKAASGSLTLTGNSGSYAGATLVQAGSLAVDGSLGGNVDVALAAILAGTGTIGGNVAVAGTHAPGGGATVGSQTINGSLTYAAGSILEWELIANTTGGAGNFDQVLVPNGNLVFSGSTSLALDFAAAGSGVVWSDAFWNVNRTWLIVDLSTGATTGETNLAVSTQAWLDSTATPFATARPNGSFSVGMTGQDVVLNYVAVPEPPAGMAVLGGLAGLGVYRLRRRQA